MTVKFTCLHGHCSTSKAINCSDTYQVGSHSSRLAGLPAEPQCDDRVIGFIKGILYSDTFSFSRPSVRTNLLRGFWHKLALSLRRDRRDSIKLLIERLMTRGYLCIGSQIMGHAVFIRKLHTVHLNPQVDVVLRRMRHAGSCCCDSCSGDHGKCAALSTHL